MDAVLLALLVGVIAGIANAGTQLSLHRAPDVQAGSLLMTVAAFLVALLAVAILDSELGSWDDLWPYFVLGAVVPGVSTILFVQAIRDAGVSRTGVLINTFPLFAAGLAIVLLDEPLRIGLVLGTVLLVLGAVGLTLRGSSPGSFRGTALRVGLTAAILGAILLGGRDVVVRWTGEEDGVSAELAAAITLGTGSLTMLAYLVYTGAGTHLLVRVRQAAPPFLLLGVVVGLGNVAIFEALERGRVTVVSPLIGTAALWTIVFSALVFGKSDAINRRVVVSGLLVAGGVALIGATRG